MKLGVVGGIAALAGAALAGCGGGIPQCNEDSVKDAVIEAFKQREREHIELRLSEDAKLGDDCTADADVANEYLNQEFQLVAVRTQGTKEGTRHCSAEVHGRKMTFHNFCEQNPATLTDDVRLIERKSYGVFVDDDGYAHVR